MSTRFFDEEKGRVHWWPIIKWCCAALIALALIGWALGGLGLVNKWVFGTATEAIRYDIHKESQIFRDGQIGEIRSLLQTYAGSESATQRRLLCRNILDEADKLGRDKLPADLFGEIQSLGTC